MITLVPVGVKVAQEGSVVFPSACLNASHAALWTACQGVRSHPVPVALVGEVYRLQQAGPGAGHETT